MHIHYLADPEEVGAVSAHDVAHYLRETIQERGAARIIVATGASQFAFLAHLVQEPGIDWSRVTMFHLDEYIDLPPDHPAGFGRYLHERLIDKVHPGTVVLINGQNDPAAECRRVGELISQAPVDAAFVGIGENGHLAFNDPPADFETTEPFLVVPLDERSRRQQLGEGWFATLDEVPSRAISMSVNEIMRARKVFCMAPEQRKAEAIRACLEEEVSPLRPASILRRHPDVELYLDRESAALLTQRP
jgi:glucosamine-6-phosphate deaminase